MKRILTVTQETWPLKRPFIIARSTRTEARTISVAIRDGEFVGHGEAVPSARYGESIGSVIVEIENLRAEIERDLSRNELQHSMTAGSGRNAIDTAMWDLECKVSGQDVSVLSGLQWPTDITTVQTISIMSPSKMAAEAKRLRSFPVLKIKMNAELVMERIRAVNHGAPQSRLLIDANESWSMDLLENLAPQLSLAGVDVIEQPLKSRCDAPLMDYESPIPIFADESCKTRADLAQLSGKYAGINIKLDKTGGLTEAIALLNDATTRGFQIMLGCMLGTSLGIAPAMFVATRAKYVDIDAPALLAEDREHRVRMCEGGRWRLPRSVWGAPISA